MNFSIKSLLSASILALTSASAFAFQSEVDITHFSTEGSDEISLGYRYHIADVSLKDTAWSEASFMNKSTFIEAAILRPDPYVGSRVDTSFTIGGRANFAENWYVEGYYFDFDKTESLGLSSGYYYRENATVFVGFSHLETKDSFVSRENDTFSIGTKSIFTLNGNQFLNLEGVLSRIEFDNTHIHTLGLETDYYFNPKTSIGAEITLFDDSDVGEIIEFSFQHYLNKQFGLFARYLTQDKNDGDTDDTVTFGLNIRF